MARRIITIRGEEDDLIIHVHKVLQMIYWKNGDRRVPKYIEKIMLDEQKARRGGKQAC